MACYVCGAADVEHCPLCGRPYCDLHGGIVCQECSDAGQRLSPPKSVVPSARLYRSAIGVMVLALVITVALVVAPPGPWPVETSRGAAAPESPGIEEEVTTQQTAIAASPVATATPSYQQYTVRAGDTLLDIAITYDTTVEAIVAANKLEDAHRLEIGQVLLIPSAGEAGPVATATATTTPTETTPSPVATPAYRQYTVRAGDTLLDIAIRYDTTVEAIIAANKLGDAHRLDIGQVLLIP